MRSSVPSLRAAIIPVTPFQQNCTLLWSDATRSGVVVDPGGEVDRIVDAIQAAGIAITSILLTHGHIDHAGGAADLREQLDVPIEGPHEADRFLLENLAATGRSYGLSGARDVIPDRWLAEGDQVRVGDLTLEVLHCPGHSPGSVAFVSAAQGFAQVGDVLFRGSVGRTDLPGGDAAVLIRSIRDKLLPLGDDVGFICGHGPSGTIGEERATNPYLRGLSPAR
jgi:glyoxylase-like metal-dependent hydrolase (beta-lactamase superfamily II)